MSEASCSGHSARLEWSRANTRRHPTRNTAQQQPRRESSFAYVGSLQSARSVRLHGSRPFMRQLGACTLGQWSRSWACRSGCEWLPASPFGALRLAAVGARCRWRRAESPVARRETRDECTCVVSRRHRQSRLIMQLTWPPVPPIRRCRGRPKPARCWAWPPQAGLKCSSVRA